MANKPPDGIFLWDVGLGLEQKKLILPQKPTVPRSIRVKMLLTPKVATKSATP